MLFLYFLYSLGYSVEDIQPVTYDVILLYNVFVGSDGPIEWISESCEVHRDPPARETTRFAENTTATIWKHQPGAGQS